MAAAEPAVQLIDQRGIAKVPTFSGRREHFEEWAFPFESYCGLLGWERYLDSAKGSVDEIEILNLSDEAARVGRSLYHLLVSTTKGTALSIVRLTERGNGFCGSNQVLAPRASARSVCAMTAQAAARGAASRRGCGPSPNTRMLPVLLLIVISLPARATGGVSRQISAQGPFGHA